MLSTSMFACPWPVLCNLSVFDTRHAVSYPVAEGRTAMMSVVETIETAEDRAITALFAEIRTELGDTHADSEEQTNG